MISSDIFPNKVNIMASVNMSRIRVLRVNMMIIFFQKLSCTNHVLRRKTTPFILLSPIADGIVIII